jgi:DNA polymerase-3 subunit delta'
MSFSSIIGQPLAVSLVQRWIAKGSNNPLLFYGPDGVGKRTLALETAKALNCPAMSNEQRATSDSSLIAHRSSLAEACGQCLSCRKIATGQHPDVRFVDLAYQAAERNEELEKQQSLRIETVLEERRRLLESPVEGSWKVSILDDAHRLTPDAANVLLKILEEPPARSAIFLLTPYRDRLFATIVSRCQPVRFRPLSDEEMQRCLSAQKVPEQGQMRLIELALGSPGRALHMNRAETIEALQEAEELWTTVAAKRPAEILAKGESRLKANRMSRAEVEERLQQLLIPALRDLRSGKVGATCSVRLLQQALTQLRQNVQPQSVYDHLMLQLARQRKD